MIKRGAFIFKMSIAKTVIGITYKSIDIFEYLSNRLFWWYLNVSPSITSFTAPKFIWKSQSIIKSKGLTLFDSRKDFLENTKKCLMSLKDNLFGTQFLKYNPKGWNEFD